MKKTNTMIKEIVNTYGITETEAYEIMQMLLEDMMENYMERRDIKWKD